MKIAQLKNDKGAPALALNVRDTLYEVSALSEVMPSDMDGLFARWDDNMVILAELQNRILSRPDEYAGYVLNMDTTTFLPPTVTRPVFRDFYAFLQHVKAARALRGLPVVDEWYAFPVFYFSNPNVFYGHNTDVPRPSYTSALDFELEIACIIAREGRDIPVDRAMDYIAGYTILNDFSARDIQKEEMRVGLGPAKSKDFASGLGPWLVTPDAFAGHGKEKGYNAVMTARKNGKEVSRGNWADIHYSFAEMIARASQSVTLYPGDVVGSGTVGTGCILELRPENTDGWLEPGDIIELEIEHIGCLRHRIR
ncbi:MAG: fumarylacetoacetate hydrolase family protein [Calditrichaeota bacterium]|nr:MAG: fumarylacetoacetate hydrolase family protein [Calditrichota bacterium]